MIKSFSGQVAFVLQSADPYLLTLAKIDYPIIQFFANKMINEYFKKENQQ